MRAFFEGESTTVPSFYVNRIRNDLQGYWDALPAGALDHDQNAYLQSTARTLHPKAPSPRPPLDAAMAQ